MLPPNLLFVANHPLLLLFVHTLSSLLPWTRGVWVSHLRALSQEVLGSVSFPFTGRKLVLRLTFLFGIPSYYRPVEDRTIWRKFFLGTIYGRGRVFVISFVLCNAALLPFYRCPSGDLHLGVRWLAWLESPFSNKVAYRKSDTAWDLHGEDGGKKR